MAVSVRTAVLAALATAAGLAAGGEPQTPIRHLVIVVGENTAFDTLFATYRPPAGSTVRNLLAQGIVDERGEPGPNFALAVQKQPKPATAYAVDQPDSRPLAGMPRPHARAERGAARRPDPAMPETLPPGPYPITRYRAYAAYADSNPVHRFFQMWQQINGGRHDLFVWTGQTAGEGARERSPNALPAPGSEAMGFYNMAAGDAPYLRELATSHALADNYHQAVMGGTMANFFFLATGDVARYLDDERPATPPAAQIEDPEPVPGTANGYRNSGYRSGAYTACADPAQPGVGAIRRLLAALPYRPFRDGNCEPGTWYLVNNYPAPYNHQGVRKPPPANGVMATPQTAPSIASLLDAHGIDWKWYHGGRSGRGLRKGEYSGDTDPLVFVRAIAESPAIARLVDDEDFFADAKRALPAVSFISPPLAATGHPHYGSPAHFEAYLRRIVDAVRAHPESWQHTAILVTWDEGGGYYDSGYVQPIDFFGDGSRVPLIAISPWARKGHVDHTYADHASIHKFIRRNWNLPPLSPRTRDNLPNPDHRDDAYIPANRPAIGDLFGLFEFGR